MPFSHRHILSAHQFTAYDIEMVFDEAFRLQEAVRRQGVLATLPHSLMATLFYEPSTRTRLSFEAAMQRLGGRVVSTSHAKHYSSVTKGETLQDTIQSIQQYVDVIVLRHTDRGAAGEAAAVATVPIINAGDGDGEHPTQALLDMYTILQEQGRTENLTVAMIGDMKYGRTVHSLTQLLNLYANRIIFVAPPALQIPDWVTKDCNIPYEKTESMETAFAEADILYVTRLQKERFEKAADYQRYQGQYSITLETLQKLSPTATILHPLPRVDEISPEVDHDPRAAYFRQMKNGMFVRMALLHLVLG